MTADTPYPPAPYHRPRTPHPGLRAAAVVQLIFAGLTGLGWLYLGIGVAMCTDGGSRAYCNRVSGQWSHVGLTVVVNAAIAVIAIVQARSGRRPMLCRYLGWVIAAGLVAGIVATALLWSTASGPIR